MQLLWFIILFSFTISFDCEKSNTLLLWEFKPCKDCQISYIVGTAHVPTSLVWPYLSPLVLEALDQSDTFVGELYGAPPTNCLLQPQKSLSALLEKDVETELLDFLANDSDEIVAEALYMAVNQLQWRVGLTQLGSFKFLKNMRESSDGKKELVFDMELQKRAKSKGKEMKGLESFDEQCKVFDFDTSDPEIVNMGTKMYIKTVQEDIEKVVKTFVCNPQDLVVDDGLMFDEESLDEMNFPISQELKEKMRKSDKELTEMILHSRNARMSNRILKWTMENSKNSYFFAVGAGHLLSENSIIDQLKRRLSDQEIVQIFATDQLPKLRENKQINKITKQSSISIPVVNDLEAQETSVVVVNVGESESKDNGLPRWLIISLTTCACFASYLIYKSVNMYKNSNLQKTKYRSVHQIDDFPDPWDKELGKVLEESTSSSSTPQSKDEGEEDFSSSTNDEEEDYDS